jgi:hypothetical protein
MKELIFNEQEPFETSVEYDERIKKEGEYVEVCTGIDGDEYA